MYVPRHFELDADGTAALLASAELAQLVTAHESGPVATLLPVLYRPGEALGTLVFHVTRTNEQWKDVGLGEALAILSGPDGYIDPNWYPSHAEQPTVPTWNYVTVHAWGRLVVHDDLDWTRVAVAELGAKHGYDANQLAEESMERQLRAVVGIEMPIARIQAKAKLNQNRTPADIAGAIAGLREAGGEALASAMESISLPHAEARSELVSGIRAGRRLGEATGVRPAFDGGEGPRAGSR